jgi:hypothetical protein
MIHIVGTCHKTQILTDLVRKKALGAAPPAKLAAFKKYLAQTARRLGAVAIAEEMSEDRILGYGHNAESVAQSVAHDLKIAHVYCEPDKNARRELGLRAGQEMTHHASDIAKRDRRDFEEVYRVEVRKQFRIREAFWASRLEPYRPQDNPILFVCGADHCKTFLKTLQQVRVDARVCCADWTVIAKIPCPCCM